MSDFHRRYGPWALVAGASEGLGEEFVRQLAWRGIDVVALAEKPEPLAQVCEGIAASHGVAVRSVVADLRDANAADVVRRETRDIDVGLVVYNAAHAEVGTFVEQSLESKLATIDVNCRGPARLVHELAPRLVERGRGGIILLSSMAGRQGTPLVATYAASKAFNLVLAESLYEELRPRGVDVLGWCPGATDTPGYRRSRPRDDGFFAPPVMAVQPVVREALEALGQRPSGVAGGANRLSSMLLGAMPRRWAVGIVGRAMNRRYPRDS